MKTNFKLLSGLLLACGFVAAQAASTVLDTGVLRMGVADNGGLGALGVGLVGPTGDAITPGCLCEGWGAAAGGSSGYVYGLNGSGITSALTTTTTASGSGLYAQSVVQMSNGLQVTQTYTYAAGGSLFKVSITLTNTTAGSLSDVRYARTLDWDVTPGFFGSNYTTVYGGTPTGPGGRVLTTSTNPFAVPDPMVFRGQEKDLNVVNSAGDKGGFFVFGFGELLTGASVSFDTYIGASRTVGGLKAALGSVGVEAYSYTTGNSVADGDWAPAYGYGFAGLGLPPSLPGGDVPEPASIALIGVALLGLAASRRRSA
ncbi:PEP-CTERM sorting domain-containing protein [Pelomonas sp. V22]|uniref:PEP-CTERM sorting domain-containing protein n=1 Tax=Pelomonas sp. V22 TaxID=2822139 RepID=UPI0024A94133|nr:PEP-CTERM sorting domain-containing protein [Pelomonas sp. V22]